MTGNPPPCPMFNDIDLSVLRILGETPGFKGVVPRKFDSPIIMTKSSKNSTVTNAQMCRAEVVGEPDLITQAINKGMFCKIFSIFPCTIVATSKNLIAGFTCLRP